MGFFSVLYIYTYIYTHTNTHQNILTITCVQDWSGGSQTSCLYLLAYLFAAGGRREIKLPKKEAEKSQVSGLPQNIHLSERQRNWKRREKSAFNEAIKKEIKQGGGGGSVLCFICTGIWYTYAQAHTGRALPGLSPPWDTGWAWPRRPPAVGAAPSARPKREALWFAFSQRKNRPNPPPKHPHTHKKAPSFLSRNLSDPVSGDGVSYTGLWGKPWEGSIQRVAHLQFPLAQCCRRGSYLHLLPPAKKYIGWVWRRC